MLPFTINDNENPLYGVENLQGRKQKQTDLNTLFRNTIPNRQHDYQKFKIKKPVVIRVHQR